jgi:3-oxoacyl-[acyl-carrier protein] reductase
MIDPGLKGKVVLVTGANHGIGAAIARGFAAQETQVAVTYFREPCAYGKEELAQARQTGIGGDALYRAGQQQDGQALVEQIRLQGGCAIAREVDLGNPTNIPLLFDCCEAQFGPVDVLVNNHTYCVLETFDPALVTEVPGGVQLLSAAQIDAHFAVNSRAFALLMAEYFARYLRRGARHGRIVNISTDAAAAHVANVSYAASKHAIESYSRSAAAELGPYGVTVNVVAPGPIQTGYIPPEAEVEIAKGTPLGRVGQPDDVAALVLFLASVQARWLTGQLLYAGGGWRMPQ